jgi:hypothetical protein
MKQLALAGAGFSDRHWSCSRFQVAEEGQRHS